MYKDQGSYIFLHIPNIIIRHLFFILSYYSMNYPSFNWPLIQLINDFFEVHDRSIYT